MEKVARLVKLAKEKKDENAGKKALGAAAAAGAAGHAAPGQLLGYHSVFHGNPNADTVATIKREGLKTSKGGTGTSVLDDKLKNAGTSDNVKRSKGKIHFSKSKPYASHYTQEIFGGPDMRKVVKGRIPHKQYVRAKKDPLYAKLAREAGRKGDTKRTSATTNRGIPSSRIAGGAGDKGAKQFATKRNLRRYLKSGSGKLRFAKGLGNVALSGAAATYSGKKLAEKARQKKS